jgi:hypothetical protein
MQIEVSHGEILDKITILEIKLTSITDRIKLDNVGKEYKYLTEIWVGSGYGFDTEKVNLFNVNLKLWKIEDKIREKERKKEFDSEFIELARSVYITNDERSRIKKEINIKYGSNFIEEKSYKEY